MPQGKPEAAPSCQLERLSRASPTIKVRLKGSCILREASVCALTLASRPAVHACKRYTPVMQASHPVMQVHVETGGGRVASVHVKKGAISDFDSLMAAILAAVNRNVSRGTSQARAVQMRAALHVRLHVWAMGPGSRCGRKWR